MHNKAAVLVPSIADVVFLCIFLVLSVAFGEKLLIDCDTAFHIRAGEIIMDTFSVPKHDMFSFISPHLPWTSHEWLSEVIMALIHRLSGLTGIVVFYAFMIAASFHLLFSKLRKEGGNIIALVLIILLAIASSSLHWLARPHIFSLFFMVIWYFILDSWQNAGKNRLYILPLIMLAWVNLHGGFMAGFFLLGIYLGGNLSYFFTSHGETKDFHKAKAKGFGLIMIICLLVSLINPYGYQMLLFPFRLASEKFIIDRVAEFQSPNFHNFSEIPFEIMLLIMILILSVSIKRLTVIEIALILLFLNMSLYAARYIPLFSIVTAPILARQSDAILGLKKGRWIDRLNKISQDLAATDSSARGYLWPAAAILFVIIFVASGKITYNFNEKTKPLAATEFIKKEHIPGNVYNDYEFGDYLIYSAYPQYKVFIDGRADIYGSEIMKEYFTVGEMRPGWEKILEKYRITWLMLDANSMLAKVFAEKDEWHLIYADRVANIFVRNIPENVYLIKKYSDVRPVIVEEVIK